jgi:hypothetical protein
VSLPLIQEQAADYLDSCDTGSLWANPREGEAQRDQALERSS